LLQDTRAHAEAAKEALDMSMLKGRQLRVRFAVHGAALRIKELSPYVSNEILEQVRFYCFFSILQIYAGVFTIWHR
jgi:hypothetical protein